jgi:exonuclease III
MREHTLVRVVMIGCLAGALCSSGCRNAGARARSKQVDSAASDRRIVLDGRLEEWPQGAGALADADYIYLRVSVEGQPAPLQASPEMLAIWIDADGSASTGMQMPAPSEASGMGVDLVVEFSPRKEDGKAGTGAAVYSVDSGGVRAALSGDQVEVIASPTHGADSYEVRISRHPDAQAAPALAQTLRAQGRARTMYVLSDASGKLVGWSDPETFPMPAARSAPRAGDVTVPPKPQGAVRVMSYNVLKDQLVNNPSAFARAFQVAQPDIILLQEWGADEATAAAWFTAVVTGEHPWFAASGANDVVIVSPHPLQKIGPEQLMSDESEGGEARPVRAVGALVRTPAGPVAAASLHLKCCGTTGSSEDRRRMAEARAVNLFASSEFKRAGARMAVIGGDWNLVGSRMPLDMGRMRGDLDDTEMAVAEPVVLGDAAMYTWRDARTEFPPGRLDYIVYSDSSAQVVNAFVLDTARLSERALAKMGLDRTDSAVSDHLPVIVDLMPR